MDNDIIRNEKPAHVLEYFCPLSFFEGNVDPKQVIQMSDKSVQMR